jgi:[ribosomal protein S5]-alanine N-acetyltransferase
MNGFVTPRTQVRPFTLADAPQAHAVFSDPEVMRYAAGDPDADLPATLARLRGYARMQDEQGFSKWAVWDRRSGAYLGDAGLTILSETGEIELGYRLGRAYWGQGLATELAGGWLEYASTCLRVARVIAFADPRNAASIRVMDKVGMTFAREDRLAGMGCVVYERTLRTAS